MPAPATRTIRGMLNIKGIRSFLRSLRSVADRHNGIMVPGEPATNVAAAARDRPPARSQAPASWTADHFVLLAGSRRRNSDVIPPRCRALSPAPAKYTHVHRQAAEDRRNTETPQSVRSPPVSVTRVCSWTERLRSSRASTVGAKRLSVSGLNGAHAAGPRAIQMVLVWRYCCIASVPLSRDSEPDCL